MIDEELYQQAADELNSDRRRAHIWARACALSKDDHDEARYLYTNLRVEELIAERDSGLGATDDAPSIDQNANLAMDTAPSISSTRVIPLDDTLDIDDELSPSFDMEPSLLADANLQFDQDPLFHDVTSNAAPLSPMEKEYYEKHPKQLQELEESDINDLLHQGNEDLDVLLEGIDNTHYAQDNEPDVFDSGFSDAISNATVLVNEEVEWIDDEPDEENALASPQHYPVQTTEHDDTDRFTQDLLRQADDLPGQHSDVVASEEPNAEESTWEPSPRANEAAVGTAAAIGAARYGQVSEKNQLRRPTSSIGAKDSSRLPIDLTDGKSGTEYTVFRRDQKIQAVKKGVSWSALFFTVPFLIYRHMFGTAIVYTIMTLIVAAGLIFMGLSWVDAGDSASDLIKLTTLGFGLLALIGILYLPFRHGNSWRSEKLERRGFELVARVKAGNPGKAVALARRASALD
jgi:hypothetical protein